MRYGQARPQEQGGVRFGPISTTPFGGNTRSRRAPAPQIPDSGRPSPEPDVRRLTYDHRLEE